MRRRLLRVVIWCARRHRHHYWSPLAVTLLLCIVAGALLYHVDIMLIIGEMVIALVDMGLQTYNAHHHLKHAHRSLKRDNPEHWFHLRRTHLWRELRFKAPLVLCILIIILGLLFGFRFPS